MLIIIQRMQGIICEHLSGLMATILLNRLTIFIPYLIVRLLEKLGFHNALHLGKFYHSKTSVYLADFMKNL